MANGPKSTKISEEKATAKKLRNEMYTQLKLGEETHRKIKASAYLLGEELHEFVSKACQERIERLNKEGRLTI